MSVYRNFHRWVAAATEACRAGREVYDIKDRKLSQWHGFV